MNKQSTNKNLTKEIKDDAYDDDDIPQIDLPSKNAILDEKYHLDGSDDK